ncbi:hypothetical protein AR543_20650 [Paenibacillus bovis]|uniref:Uncharacterized protein n=1 Tax=Paenibacillus bovis TaxID=1616788 RepID=A0A172ZLA7_9BACL|nr:hypothetical protein AR543_20650 [Paenibacillus bovis]
MTDIHNKLQLYAIAAAGGHDPANTDIQRTSTQINKLIAALQHISLQDEHSFAEIRAAAEAVNSLYRE